LIAAAHRAQADALEIEAEAIARKEVAGRGGNGSNQYAPTVRGLAKPQQAISVHRRVIDQSSGAHVAVIIKRYDRTTEPLESPVG